VPRSVVVAARCWRRLIDGVRLPPQGPSQRLLFLGTTSGQVKCYDVARAALLWSAGGAVDGPLAALSCSPDGAGGVLAVGSSGGAALLDASTGSVLSQWRASKHTLSAAAMLPGGRAVVAGASVAVHDAASGARLHKWTGHATPVAALAATPGGEFCVSAGRGERAAAVWSLAAGRGGRLQHKSAVARLNLDQPATHLAVSAAAPDSGAFHVAAVTQGGALRLFECAPGGDGGSVAVRQWGASAGPGASAVLMAGVEGGDSGGVNLVLAAGSAALPSFQRLRADKAEGGAQAAVAVEAPAGGALLGGRQGAAAGAAAAAGKGAGGGAQGVAVLGAAEGGSLAARFGKRAAGAAGLDGAAAAGDEEMGAAADGAADDEEGEEGEAHEGPTFGERVAALQDAAGGAPLAAAAGATSAPPAAAAAAAAAFPSGAIKADSLAVLLTQALQSGDKLLLERCLSVRNEEVVANTVRRLRPADAATFLRTAVARLQSAPARGEQLAGWVRAVLLHHTAYLAAGGAGGETLGALYQLIEARMAAYQPLLALSGRLDLVLANAQRAQRGGGAGGGEGGGGGGGYAPLVTVQVDEEGGIEVEDAFAAAGLSSDEEEDGASDGEGAANGLGSEEEEEDDA
jgi:U3 small nucleolar RNA-associated protein 5